MKGEVDVDLKTKNRKVDKTVGGSSTAITGSFRLAASAFGKKLQKWRKKKKPAEAAAAGREGDEKMGDWGRRSMDTQSEMADYGHGRRSCDVDLPRFSLDIGRVSFEKPRRSFDNPRASWDGYLVGGRGVHRMPLMGSLVEDGPVAVRRSDYKIPVEDSMNLINQDPEMPGGTVQTREYYLDSSTQRRRRSFERSKSIRKPTAGSIDELKSLSLNSKLSPAISDYIHRNRIADSKLPNSISNSLRDDHCESFKSVYQDISASRSGSKKSGWWSKSWSIWGLIHRHGSGSGKDNGANVNGSERHLRGSAVDRSVSATWQSELNGDAKGAFHRKILRSNSISGSRSSFSKNPFGNNGSDKKKKEGTVFERNQSARYSTSAIDSKLMQQLDSMPWRGSQIGVLGRSASKNSDSSSIRSAPWLY